MATLYLCGAGISANSVPVMSSFNKNFITFIGYIQKEIGEENVKLLPDIKRDINGFDTIDTYANYLFLKKEFDKYDLLKRLIDIFITARSLIGDTEYKNK